VLVKAVKLITVVVYTGALGLSAKFSIHPLLLITVVAPSFSLHLFRRAADLSHTFALSFNVRVYVYILVNLWDTLLHSKLLTLNYIFGGEVELLDDVLFINIDRDSPFLL